MSLVDTVSWSIEEVAAPSLRRGRFERHCEAEFEHLSAKDPMRLVELIGSGELEPSLLTFAAEIAGSVGPLYRPAALGALIPLLNHNRPHVREGAVYGIGRIAEAAPQAAALLERVASDTAQHEGVRAAARSVLGLE